MSSIQEVLLSKKYGARGEEPRAPHPIVEAVQAMVLAAILVVITVLMMAM